MATRKDLLKAHAFTTQRMVSSLVDRDPDAPKSPLSRITTATFVSLLIGVVALAGAMLIGKLRPGQATDYTQAGVILQDMSSGSLFVYNSSANALTPVTDITSAKLMAGEESGAEPKLQQVKASVIKNVRRLAPQGIPGAPSELPAASDITPFPLRVCLTEPDSAQQRYVSVQYGNASQNSDDYAIVVRTPDQAQYVVVQGMAHRLDPGNGRPSALRGDLPLVDVPDAWLAALPQGNPIQPMNIVGAGGPATAGGGTIGSLYRVGEENTRQVRYYVQVDSGLVRISYLDMVLQQTINADATVQPLTESQFASKAVSDEALGTPGLPMERPEAPPNATNLADTSVCLTYDGAENGRPKLAVGLSTPTKPANVRSPNGKYADWVDSASMTGMLLGNVGVREGEGSYHLVFNQKIYPIPDVKAKRALGYNDQTPVARVPAGLIALFAPGLGQGLALTTASLQ